MPDQQTPQPVPTTNQPAQQAVDLIQKLTEEGEAAAEAAIIAAEPWMGTVVIKQIWEAVFDWIVKLIMRPVAMLGGRVIISVEEYIALKSAAHAQAALDAAKKKGDPNEISQASDAVDQAVAGVIQYVGATHTQ